MSESEVDVESGLGGTLDTRGLLPGSGAKALVLVVLRIVLPAVGMPVKADDTVVEVVFRVGTAGVERALVYVGVGRPEVVADRVTGLWAGVVAVGPTELGLESNESWASCRGLLVLATGSAGRGPDGGARGEAEGRRGPVVVMAAADMTACSPSAADRLLIGSSGPCRW